MKLKYPQFFIKVYFCSLLIMLILVALTWHQNPTIHIIEITVVFLLGSFMTALIFYDILNQTKLNKEIFSKKNLKK